ncbi:hypothetical protein HYPSUDRAFT_44222 [Hypholoma sublateritium FD-334 SS-4]|uniref:NAD(P)-binding domain-containing protein n=1 Tax=Hypholoma sublateritium (strain FD-334 SS-4) TaxID=945553 RepID=A0A0D2M844_HYPSF|nr:hypothetical protein HYPSUDRAFT_44222 [Hypholoma sublateritium FD-334 SS-4]
MTGKINILLLGATGYIGGSIALRLLDHPHASKFNITALARTPEKWESLRCMGLNSVLGSFADLLLLEGLALEADVVIQVADADNLAAMQAILKGMRRHHTIRGSVPILIHTSGAAVFADLGAGGNFTEVHIYDDLRPDLIAEIPATQPHRRVDMELVEADSEGFVKTYIVLPGVAYGLPSGRLVEKGIQNSHSIAIPSLVRASLVRKRGGMVGMGNNVWPNVNVDDLADLYILLLNTIIVRPEYAAHGRDGFYFAENGEHTMYQVGKAICEGMNVMGVHSELEPSAFTQEDLENYFGGSDFLGSNCRCRGSRSRLLGWKPVKTTRDMLASVMPEVEETFLIQHMFLSHSHPDT